MDGGFTPEGWQPVAEATPTPASAPAPPAFTPEGWQPVAEATPAPPAPPAPAPGPWMLGETGTPDGTNPLDAPPSTGPKGFGVSLAEGMMDAMSQGRQLARGDAFSDQNIPPPQDRTFMGKVGYAVGPAAVTASGIGLGAAGGAAAGTAMGGPVGGTVGGVAGGVAGGGALGFAQSLIPAYQDARQRGLSHDDAVSEAYRMAAASGALTGATAPVFGWAPFRNWIGNALLHSLGTGPAVGAAQRGLITPAITGQPAPSAEEMGSGLLSDVVTGGLFTAAMHGGPALARRFMPDGRPVLDVGTPETPPGQSLLTGAPGEAAAPPPPEPPPPGSYGRELFTPPTEPPAVPPVEPPAAPPAVPEPLPGVPPIAAPPPAMSPPTPPVEPPVAPAEPAPPVAGPVDVPTPTEPPARGTPPDGEPAIPRPPEPPAAEPGLAPTPGPDGTVPLAPKPTEPGTIPVEPAAAGPGPETGPGPAPPSGTRVEPEPVAITPGTGGEQPPASPAIPPEAPAPPPPGTTVEPRVVPAGEIKPGDQISLAPGGPVQRVTRITTTRKDGQTTVYVEGEAKPYVMRPTTNVRLHEPEPATPAPPPAPGSPAEKLAYLDGIKAPDSAYRDVLSTGSRTPLKAGETWRDRVVKWVESEARPLEPATEGTAEDTLAKRTPMGARRGVTRAPGAPRPLPKIVRATPREAPKPVPEVGRAPTLEDYNYSRDVSMHRQAFHDALAGTSEDPRTAANKPMPEQISMLSKALKDKYGFTDVTVKPGGEPRIVRDQLLNMHQNMQNMAHAMGWAPEVMSLDGRVNLDLVPRQFDGGQWMGRYQWGGGTKTIQISGGSNSFAHELWHGIDNYLSDVLNKNPNKQSLFTWSGRAGELKPGQDPVQAAFTHVLNTMSHGSGEILLRRLNLERTAKLVDKAGNPTARALTARDMLDRLNSGATGGLRIPDSGFVIQAKGMRNPRYYASVEELFARMAEAYTGYKMWQGGFDTAGVVKSDQAYQDRTIRYLRDAYPDPHDRARIFAAMDMLNYELQRAAVLNHGHAPAQRASTAHTLAVWHDRPPDIGPGFVARLRDDMRALRPASLFGSDHDAVLFPAGRDPPPPTYNTKGNVPRPKHILERMGDQGAGIFDSIMGNIERWRKQIPPGARPYLTQILDRIGVSHEGRLQAPTFDERYHQPVRKLSAELHDAFRDSGLVNRVKRIHTTELEDSMIWHTLTTGENTYPVDHLDPNGKRLPIPGKVLDFAEKVRPILDRLHEMARTAGLDIGHASEGGGYAPRTYNDHKILANESEYKRDMAEVIKIIFNRDIAKEPDADQPARLHEWWRAMGDEVRDHAMLDPRVRDAMVQLGKNLRRVRAIERELAAGPGGPGVSPTLHDPVKLNAERDQLRADNKNIFDRFHARVRDHYAPIEASNRFHQIAQGGPSNFETFGPKSEFLKGRTLPPEADRILRNWLIQKPREGLLNYINGMSRKIAYHEVFGENGGEIEALITHMVDAGAHRTITDEVRRTVELLTGRALRDTDNAVTTVTNTVSALGTMMLLPGASITALAEPAATLINGGNMRQLIRTYTNLVGQILGTAKGAERMAAVRYIGGVIDSMQSSAAANRFQDYSGTPRIASLVNGFMELAMGKMIRHLRAAGLDAGSRHLMPLLLHYATEPAKGDYELNRQDDAQRMLREWGVPDARMVELRDFLDSAGGPPTPAQMADAGRTGALYEMAANRMLDRFNQDPTPAEKPIGALKNPVLQMMFGLTSFIYTFFRHTMIPWLERAAHARQREFDRSTAEGDRFPRMQAEAARFASWTGAITGMAIFLAGTALLYTVRTFFLSHQTWKKHQEAGDLIPWLISGAISQSGIAGPVDIIFQGLTGLRYRADISTFTQGAYPAALTRGLTDVARMFAAVFGKTPGTNTDVYNGLYALIQMIAKPGMLASLTWLAQHVPEGGPLAALITAASVVGTSSTVTRGAVGALAGERGTTLPREPERGRTHLAPIQLPHSDRAGPRAAKDAASGGSGMTAIAAGALDDLAVPALRMMPPWGTAAAVGLGSVAALGAVLKQAHEYKAHGTPPDAAR